MSSSKVIIPPADLPITLNGAKQFLQVSGNDEDALINFLIEAATSECEQKMQRALKPRTVRDTMASWDNAYMHRWCPVAMLTHIKYYNTDNVLTDLATDQYWSYIHEEYGLDAIKLRTGVTFPEVYDRPDAIQITYVAGYGTAGTIPYEILAAIQLKTRHKYDFRTDEAAGNRQSPMSIASDRLLLPYINYMYTTGL